MAEMIDQTILARCRHKLEETAHKGRTITYGDLAAPLGVNARNGLTKYLNRIYDQERALGHPDLTSVAVNKRTGLGRFNSNPGPAQSSPVDPKNQQQVAAYKAELARAHSHWK
jgi:hypothetical protein